MSSPRPSSRPKAPWQRWTGYTAAVAIAWIVSGARCEAAPGSGGLASGAALLRQLARPDLGAEALGRGLELAVQTLAVALWGTTLGAIAGFGLALFASHNIMLEGTKPGSTAARAMVGGARTLLDVLRAIPDFAWALGVLVFIGAGPVTGMVAIAISVAGLLGKTYSQLLDAVSPAQVAPARSVGASRWNVGLWGYVPAARGTMLSYTLLRLECSIRNASVIGIVGGGGLGAALFEELGFGRYDRVATLLGFLLLLTALGDRGSKWLLRVIQTQSRRRQRLPLGILATGLLLAAALLWPDVQRSVAELGRLDVAFLRATFTGLLDIGGSGVELFALVEDSLVPVGIAIVSTGAASLTALALVLAFPLRSAPATAPRFVRVSYRVTEIVLDAAALLSRAIPDVVWLLLFAVSLGMGPTAAVAAIAVHSFGLLARLFTEVVADVAADTVEARRHGSATTTFAWGIWPDVAPRFQTHIALQVEANLRAGLIVGIVGAGGLGDAFADSIRWWRLGDATLQALAMVVVTILVDRIARAATRPSA